MNNEYYVTSTRSITRAQAAGLRRKLIFTFFRGCNKFLEVVLLKKSGKGNNVYNEQNGV